MNVDDYEYEHNILRGFEVTMKIENIFKHVDLSRGNNLKHNSLMPEFKNAVY
jgi:hypothetical protein